MRALALALLAGCYSPAPPAGAPCGENGACPSGMSCVGGFCGGGSATDAEVVAIDAIDALTCTTWNARHVEPCALPAPIGDLSLTDALSGFSWDTDTGELKGKMGTVILVTTMTMTQADGPDVLLASVNDLTMEAGATLTVTGDRALLIAVNGTAQIDGDITANAVLGTAGPGGSGFTTDLCPSEQTGNPGTAGTPATGGGGGGFQGNGGRGGNTGGLRGVGLAAPPTVIRGGCAGGGGGVGTGAGAPRGGGGGAIAIDARIAIQIGAGGSISAGGGGGSSGRAFYGGGGGGGSGGLIGLNAPLITVAGTLAANGGGGGGGASDIGTGGNGNTGAASANAAAGGSGATASTVGACGKGGNGSFGGTLDAQDGTTVPCGGGGAGGGAGFILFWSPTQTVTGTVSPPALSGP